MQSILWVICIKVFYSHINNKLPEFYQAVIKYFYQFYFKLISFELSCLLVWFSPVLQGTSSPGSHRFIAFRKTQIVTSIEYDPVDEEAPSGNATSNSHFISILVSFFL